MKIIVDVMGGDRAPAETVKGAFWALDSMDVQIVMVGDRNEIERVAKENNLDLSRVELVHTDEVITMNDDPMLVARGKKNSSMSVGLRMLTEGEGDAFVSTGNTGALFTGATLIVRKVKGIQRAGIGSILPCQKPALLLDTGANVVVSEENLEQFAVIGAAYMKKIYGVENPRVGLLNNGAEEHKGTPLQQSAYQLLSKNPDVNFVGNIEGSVLPFDVCDVLVTDGFSGNILLKTMEGAGKMILSKLKDVFYASAKTKFAGMLVKPRLAGMKKELDPSETGGAPILGISKPVIKAHGSSDAKAFKNAIAQAKAYAESGAIEEIAAVAERYAVAKKAEREKQKQESSEAQAVCAD